MDGSKKTKTQDLLKGNQEVAPINKKTRGRLARMHFSPGAHPAAETPFYIAAASVSARGDAQCVWSHESSISSSYERKHGSARSHIFTSVKTRRVKLVKLETNYRQKDKQSIAKLTRRPQFLQSNLALCKMALRSLAL